MKRRFNGLANQAGWVMPVLLGLASAQLQATVTLTMSNIPLIIPGGSVLIPHVHVQGITTLSDLELVVVENGETVYRTERTICKSGTYALALPVPHGSQADPLPRFVGLRARCAGSTSAFCPIMVAQESVIKELEAARPADTGEAKTAPVDLGPERKSPPVDAAPAPWMPSASEDDLTEDL